MNDSAKADRVRAAREGFAVERAHFHPHHDSYTVGLHSGNMVSMLLLLHPEPSLTLIKACQFHDCAERWVGDLPWAAKHASSVLKEEHEALEDEVIKDRLGFEVPLRHLLSPEELGWLHGLDMVEFLLWCQEQRALGSTLFDRAIRDVAALLGRRHEEGALPRTLWDLLARYNPARLDDEV